MGNSDKNLNKTGEQDFQNAFDEDIKYAEENLDLEYEADFYEEEMDYTGEERGIETGANRDIAYLVGLNLARGLEGTDQIERSLLELKELAETVGALVLGGDYQNADKINASTFIGKGKLEEISEEAKSLGCNTLIFDDELSGSQIRNIQEVAKMRVIDRTMVILDIFARRATSKEGKLQVELAQYNYRLSRVSMINEEFDRLGGSIGTRGPGETQLEKDRRHIRRRITLLQRELKDVSKRRVRERDKRDDKGQTIVAVVGYTNAGKSTLINKLTGSELFAMDQVFATLDSSFRTLRLPEGSNVMLADTVGFIRKLPHELIEAFNSTLSEVSDADLILQVLDVSDAEAEDQLEVVENQLIRLDAAEKPRVMALNKIDQATPEQIEKFMHYREDHENFRVMPISAVTGEGLDEMLDVIAEFLAYRQRNYRLSLPYSQSSLYAYIKDHGNLLAEEFAETMNLEFTLDVKLSGPVERYLQETYPERYAEELA